MASAWVAGDWNFRAPGETALSYAKPSLVARDLPLAACRFSATSQAESFQEDDLLALLQDEKAWPVDVLVAVAATEHTAQNWRKNA
jgi:hypothetical protein